MRRAKDVVGLPVLTFRTGRKIDEVKDVLFDPEQNRVLALLTDNAGWFTDARVVPFDRVKSVGRDAVIVEDERAEIPASSRSDIRRAIEGNRVITNMRVFTEDGRDIGSIGDMFFDENTGEVTGYEVSGGFLAETLRGKHFMPAPATMVMGRDVTYVPSETGDRIEREVTGGVQKGLGEARAAAGRATEAARAQTDELLRASTEQQKRFVVGKRADSTVRTPEGTVIVQKGSPVRQTDADLAERSGVLGQLVASVVGAQTGAAAAGARETGPQFQRGAAQAYEDVRRTFTDIGRGAEEETQRARIKGALGRPATRVILDEDDNVILNTGDIVTHEAIDRARRAGVLDVLLSSVSTEKPSFSVEQRRLRESGEASHPTTEAKSSFTTTGERMGQHKTEDKSHHGHEEKRKK